MNTYNEQTFALKFVENDSAVLLELMNMSGQTLRSVEILTIFLKDEEIVGGGPSTAHIKFESVKAIQPQEKSVMPHRTWINGKPVAADKDQLQRLKPVAGSSSPYVLDISWQDPEGKTRFQRIPVGH